MNSTIINFLKHNTNWNVSNISSIEKIGGLSSENYKVIYEGKIYFIKVCTHTYLHTDRKNELNIIKKVSKLNIAPHIYYFSHKSGNMICEWINGHIPTEDEFSSEYFLSNVADTLKKLHTLKCEKFFNPFDHIKKRLKICKSLNLHLPSSITLLTSYLNELEVDLTKNKLIGLCHNDLNVSNIISYNNKTYFVDYEYSSMGDIFFDLATLSWFLDIEGRRILLSKYFGYFDNQHYKKLLDYLFVVKFYNATWSLLKSTDSNSDYDYLEGAKMIFDDLLNVYYIRIYKN